MSEEERTAPTVIWKFHRMPGHETCRLLPIDDGWRIDGAAVFIHAGKPCRLAYLVDCDADWLTRAAVVTGWVGDESIDVVIARDDDFVWNINGVVVPEVDGCTDIDLNFSPATNTLPIRRLVPDVGDTVAVRAAWLRFPTFKLEELEQSYTRMGQHGYRYESAGGSFVAELTVDDDGLVIDYGDIWTRETGA